MNSSVNVLADAQFTVARTLKPFKGFERAYQGQAPNIPIAIPGGTAPEAGTPGYAPNLAAGFPVPLGARCTLWVPLAISTQNESTDVTLYDYCVVHRLRGIVAWTENRQPYHMAKQFPGVADTTAITGGARFVIPAAAQLEAFEQTEPGGATDPGVLNLRQQIFTPRSGLAWPTPLLPTLNLAALQQGTYDPNVSLAIANEPIFNPFWFDAEGDEIIILVRRTDQGAGVWDFTSTDLAFSNIYGTGNGDHAEIPDLGIFIMTGANP